MGVNPSNMSSAPGKTAFPLIDSDPYAGRVVRYMRPSDYTVWAGATVAFPGMLYAYEMADPTRLPRRGLTPALRLCTVLGFAGGFLLAYQRSSFRFWGWTENSLEQKKDYDELSQSQRLASRCTARPTCQSTSKTSPTAT